MKPIQIKDHFLTQEDFQLVERWPGILQTLTVPNELEKYYASDKYISHHQDSKSLKEILYKQFQNLNFNYKKNILRTYLPNGATVLDYGCGAGEFLKAIEQDYSTTGLEPAEAARAYAQQKAQRTTFIDSIVQCPNDGFDAITLWHVFEHIADPEGMLSIFKRKLKKDGYLIIAVPNFSSYDAEYYGEHWAAFDVPRHLFHYSRKGMISFLQKSKFEVIEIKPLIFDAYYISLLSEQYRKNPLSVLKAPLIGAISNFKALKTGEYSSLIYILRNT